MGIHGSVDNAEQNLASEKYLTHNHYKRWNEEPRMSLSGKKSESYGSSHPYLKGMSPIKPVIELFNGQEQYIDTEYITMTLGKQ